MIRTVIGILVCLTVVESRSTRDIVLSKRRGSLQLGKPKTRVLRSTDEELAAEVNNGLSEEEMQSWKPSDRMNNGLSEELMQSWKPSDRMNNGLSEELMQSWKPSDRMNNGLSEELMQSWKPSDKMNNGLSEEEMQSWKPSDRMNNGLSEEQLLKLSKDSELLDEEIKDLLDSEKRNSEEKSELDADEVLGKRAGQTWKPAKNNQLRKLNRHGLKEENLEESEADLVRRQMYPPDRRAHKYGNGQEV